MTNRSWRTLAVVSVAAWSISVASGGEPSTAGRHVCLVDGNRVEGDLYLDDAGVRLYACCAECLEKITKDAGYVRLIEQTGRQPEQIPINRSGERTEREALEGMVLIAGGEMTRPGRFLVRRGRTPEPAEHEPFRVRISPFYIDQYEVTYEDYCKFVNDGNEKYATGGITPSDDGTFVPPRGEWARFPVRGTNFYHARGYAEWAGKRLPTEAQWEFAHGGSDRRLYPWGSEEPDETRANFGPALGGLKPVGSFPKGRTPEGVFDLAGNIGEWCADFYDEEYYRKPSAESPVVDPQGPESGFLRVYRLGCQCQTATAKDLHANLRCSATPFRQAGCVGFRCVRSANPEGVSQQSPGSRSAPWVSNCR